MKCLFRMYLNNNTFLLYLLMHWSIVIQFLCCSYFAFNPVLLNYFCLSKSFTFDHWELFHLSPVSLWHTPPIWDWFVLCILSYFLELHKVSGSSYKFSVPVLELTISPGSPGSFYWRTMLHTKTWMLGVLFTAGELLLSITSRWQRNEMCMLNCLEILRYITICICVKLNMSSSYWCFKHEFIILMFLTNPLGKHGSF